MSQRKQTRAPRWTIERTTSWLAGCRRARLDLLRITAPARLADAGADLDAARAAVTDGVLGYALLTAVKSL
ncbi:hypothetical protein PV963_05860 [Streptomyces coeruleorubidus]|uniref:hypothetical protein n=1 Tax=Streptomyces coeruleorubidus TaxID=116188 RepID=UPI00237FB39B|nr:hypothetical protein [Streptomyces coeruleorubidus]WDV49920.1 hypothetical protein PV963_05860 [Streptomyces coeruleorubidus]